MSLGGPPRANENEFRIFDVQTVIYRVGHRGVTEKFSRCSMMRDAAIDYHVTVCLAVFTWARGCEYNCTRRQNWQTSGTGRKSLAFTACLC